MTGRTTTLRVAVVERRDLLAESLCIVLDRHGHRPLRVKPRRPGGTPSATAVLVARPDVVLLDHDLVPPGSADSLIEALSSRGVAVVVLTDCDDPARWGEALAAGARRVLPLDGQLGDVLGTLRGIALGVPVMPREQRAALIDAWRREQRDVREAHERLSRLSRREQQVLEHLAEGRTVGDIAATDVVAVSTVRTQVRSVLTKLGVSSQLSAVALARNGRVPTGGS